MRLLPVMLLLALACAFVGCSSSNVYDASLGLPSSPLRNREINVQGTAGAFPQTRPDAVGSAFGYGASGTGRFAVADWLSVQGRYWGTASGDEYASGVSTSLIIRTDTDTVGWRYALVPSFGWTFVGDNAEGMGGSFVIAAWTPNVGALRPYVGVGGAYGWSTSSTGTSSPDSRPTNGWGVILNTGAHYVISSELSVLAELSTIAQMNNYDDVQHVILSPVVGVSYRW